MKTANEMHRAAAERERGYLTEKGTVSLRDYFAAKIMHALMREPLAEDEEYDDFVRDNARAAYAAADVMLAERAK